MTSQNVIELAIDRETTAPHRNLSGRDGVLNVVLITHDWLTEIQPPCQLTGATSSDD
ncbi:MAG: hypothetical protein ACOC0P_02950 [Planctomycetota bacterium]